ncbi:MAG: GntR family transcriptional regulator, rspAB operon transcriptional repressor [Acidimicrobiaceae bacterium]|nr:GntR family transcriptional regulator, rspAB operon transcriptional repressor [Acidimicrobiaceae bacterium]
MVLRSDRQAGAAQHWSAGTGFRRAPDSGGQELGLSQKAYESLSRAIGTCEAAPGSIINEREIGTSLGMSRTPVRQALHRLALEGLVEVVPRKGVVVTLLDLRDLNDNLVVREALELASLRKVFEADLPIDLADLRARMAVMRRAAKAKDDRAFLEADEEFHLAVAAAAGNERLMQSLVNAWVHINRSRYLRVLANEHTKLDVSEHRAILEGLEARDRKATERAMRVHIRTAVQLVGDLTHRLPWAFVVSADGAEPAAL